MFRGFGRFQVFLNYPYDDEYIPFAEAMSFAVVAAGMLPLCALDISQPDVPRLRALVEAIESCDYSAHDLARSTGEGEGNLARMNVPLEMGMAVFHALSSQRSDHRCSFFVPDSKSYHRFASDLAGLDPFIYDGEGDKLLAKTFEWLRSVVPTTIRSDVATPDVQALFQEFQVKKALYVGTASNGSLNHGEARELIYQVCSNEGWWDWRHTKAGKAAFPVVPLHPA